MQEGNMSFSVSIYELSHEKLTVAVPTIVCLCILIVIGLIGNIFVVVVFGFKMKKQSTYRHFILVLAMYDLTACGVGMPGLAVELSRPYLFYSVMGCKTLRYGFHIIAGGSSITHLLVGIDRYRRICRATGIQMSVGCAKVSSLCVISVTVIAASPVVIMYDIVPVGTKLTNMSGNACAISEQYSETVFPLLFHGTVSLFTLVVAVALIILYSLIGHRICNHVDFFKNMEHTATGRDTHGSKRGTIVKSRNRVEPAAQTSLDPSVQESTAYGQNQDQESESVIKTVTQVTDARDQEQSSNIRQKQSREMLSRKMTVVTFAIMVVFIVSFVPLEVLVLETLSHRGDIELDMTYTQQVFYSIGYHSYVINNVANPLIYLFMDVEFRKHCKRILASLRCT